MDVTSLPMITEVKLVQPTNASETISLTLPRILICFKLVQNANACLPISLTLLGILIKVKLVQPANAP